MLCWISEASFWEDFDIDWIEGAGRIDEIVGENETDIHASYGKFCYKKLRHSLCHGWAGGHAPFISKHILGINILKPGCKKISVTPDLGDLEWAKGTYPTPYGVISLEHRKVDGKIQTRIDAPEEIEIQL